MSFLDMRTVLFTGVIIGAMCTFVVASLWRENRKRFDGMAFWMIDLGLQTVGLLLIILRGAVSDLVSIVLANTLVVVGAFMGLLGLSRFIGARCLQIHNIVLLAAFPLVHAYFTFTVQSLTARNLNASLSLLVLCSQCLWLLHRRTPADMRPFMRWLTAVFTLYCAINAFRIAWILAHLSSGHLESADYLHSETIEVIIQSVMQLLLVLLTYGLALMLNRRLIVTISVQEEKYSKAFHSSPYAITLTRLSDGKIFEVNRGFEKITGFPQEEVVGKTTAELHLWARIEDRDHIVGALIRSGAVRGLERQFQHKSGALIDGLYSAEILTIHDEQYILASINDISDRKEKEAERERLLKEREKAVSEAKILSGMLPICASCKKIRDDKGYWRQIETYIRSHSEAEFSHGICPECEKRLYPDLAGK